MLLGQIIGGELDQGDAVLEVTFSAWWPVNANIELNTLELGAVVNLNVGIAIEDVEGGDDTLGGMLELLVDEVENQNLVLDFLGMKMISFVCSRTRHTRLGCCEGKTVSSMGRECLQPAQPERVSARTCTASSSALKNSSPS